MATPYEVATWRFEQISPLLDRSLPASARRVYMEERTSKPVDWPRSEKARARDEPPRRKPIGRSTLYRWLRLYREGGFEGLLPATRQDKGKGRVDRSVWVAHALALLYERPSRSLTQLLVSLRIAYPGAEDLTRSTLHRELQAHPAYRYIQRLREGFDAPLRDRFEADYPHQCWQLDGKGPVEVRFRDGGRARVHFLSILDDYSRCCLATVVASAEDIPAAVRVFRMAALRWGLPERIQFDRGSAFGSHAFRRGLAILGAHRNWVKERDPSTQGKIESYHDCLQRWVVEELPLQVIVDLLHLEKLHRASVDLVYNEHDHRGLKATPADRLDGRVSERRVAAEDLLRPFWREIRKSSDTTTGELSLPNGRFRVPRPYAGHRETFRYDPVEPRADLVTPAGQEIELDPFETKHPFREEDTEESEEPWGTGELQKIHDEWKGRTRPNAPPGFGLPEVFAELGRLVGHLVPDDEREGRAIARFWRREGPLPEKPFREAVDRTLRDLGEGRPLKIYLEHLARLCRQARETAPDPLDPDPEDPS